MKLNERTLAILASDQSSSCDKAGFLMKKGEVNKGFQKRYFVLRGNMLFYFEKKQDKEPVGVIILENCHVELCGAELSLFAFQIVFDGSGCRKYVLAAENNEEMENWMKMITHAGHDYIRTVVEQLEEKLSTLKKAESRMSLSPATSANEESLNSSFEQPELASPEQSDSRKIPTVSVSKPFQKKKYQTLPPRRLEKKEKTYNNVDPAFNRWSFSSSLPDRTSGSSEPDFTNDLQDLIDFSERTDFLHGDAFHSSRHFSINDFTPPSYSELKMQEDKEDQTLFDLDGLPVDNKLPSGKLAFSNNLASKIKNNRRAKSERHRKIGPISAPKSNFGGSFYNQRKLPKGDSSITDDNDSKFQYLHRLWGAAIWVKVREYELEHCKDMDSRL